MKTMTALESSPLLPDATTFLLESSSVSLGLIFGDDVSVVAKLLLLGNDSTLTVDKTWAFGNSPVDLE